MIAGGQPFSPRLHVAMHHIVASQLAGRRPARDMADTSAAAGMGYDRHNTMHMIAALTSDDLYHAMKEHQPFDPGDYARRLDELPGDWPPPQAPGPNRR